MHVFTYSTPTSFETYHTLPIVIAFQQANYGPTMK